jgi:mxaK protein
VSGLPTLAVPWCLVRRLVVGGAALALLAAVAIDGSRLLRALEYNRVIDAAETAGAVDATAARPPASTLFVRAHAAAQARRPADALALYQAASRDARYTVAAQYNLGNLHLREAMALQERNELQDNPQPVELAKRHFRAALHADPSHWPSKYNLERALQLAPESPEDNTPAAGHAADRVVTSLRGFTLGLP